MTRVAVLGASGFVGCRVVERLRTDPRWDIVPVVHSSGNAWRVARLGIPLQSADLLDESSLGRVLAGCTHVVNCSRGDDAVMLKGFRRLLQASRRSGVRRFVHLSSVAVYGDPPPTSSASEGAPTNPARGSYGWVKLEQDRMLQAAVSTRFAAVALCPPNIGGPYSPYLLAILAALRGGRLPLVDDGRRPCMLVDVDNLAQAIVLALDGGPADGRRLFVTDGRAATWRQVMDALTRLLPKTAPAPVTITAVELSRMLQSSRPPRASVMRSLKHLVSGEVREALRRDPLLARLDRFVRQLVAFAGPALEQRMRQSIEGPAVVPRPGPAANIELRLASQQLRDVEHSPQAAFDQLGYRPSHDFDASMRAFSAWYRAMTGLDSRFGDLYARLYS